MSKCRGVKCGTKAPYAKHPEQDAAAELRGTRGWLAHSLLCRAIAAFQGELSNETFIADRRRCLCVCGNADAVRLGDATRARRHAGERYRWLSHSCSWRPRSWPWAHGTRRARTPLLPGPRPPPPLAF